MNIITNTTEVTLDTKPVRNKNAKSVYCISDGNVYASGIDAAEKEGVSPNAIYLACHGKSKTCNGKLWCFVKDMHIRILDISNATKELVKDADVYRKQEAERKAKEAHKQALHNLEERMIKRKLDIQDMQEQLIKDEQMYEAMRKEFVI